MLTSSQQRHAILAATLGNGLEFYDFIIFAFFAIQLGQTFFPTDSTFLSLMASLTTFGAGFMTRPIGAFFLGGYADKYGRKPAMLLSMTMMGISTLTLVLTPSYQTIGIMAPIIVITTRLIQGFALGGEVGISTPYLIESADADKRGRTVAWQGASQQIATTLGALVSFILSTQMTPEQLTSYGWRIALFFGASIVPFALWIRHSLPETLDNHSLSTTVSPRDKKAYWKAAILGSIIIGNGAIGTYIFNYMATFGQHTLKLSTSVSLLAEFGINFIALITVLLGGWMSDHWGQKRTMIWPQTILVLAIMPCFWWLTSSVTPTTFIVSTVLLSAVAAPQYAALYAILNENIPHKVRARVFALAYAIPIAICGGTTQAFVTWLIHVTGKPISIAWYFTIVSIIGLIAMILMRENPNKDLY